MPPPVRPPSSRRGLFEIEADDGRGELAAMAPDAPREARWVRSEPRRAIPAEESERMVRRAFPRGRIVHVEPLAGGLRNANFKLTLDSTPGPIVLRVYEHDASLCRKEADLMRLVGGSVPVPEVILAEPAGDGLRPFMLQGYVEGPTLRELVVSARSEDVAEAARSAGQTLAAIGLFTFANPGWIAPGPTVTDPLLPGADPMPRFVEQCLASPLLQRDGSRRSCATRCRRRCGRTPPRSAGQPTRRLSFTAISAGGTSSSGGRPAAGSWRRCSTGSSRSPVPRSPTSDTSFGTSEGDGRRLSGNSNPAIWRAAAGCRRSGAASRDSSISSRSARC